MEVKPISAPDVADERLDRRAVQARQVLRPGEVRRTVRRVDCQAPRDQAPAGRVAQEDILAEEGKITRGCARPGQLREVPFDRRVGRDGVDREPHADRAVAVVEGLLETQDLAVNLQTVDRRLELLVQVLVNVGEEVERVEDAVLRVGRLVLGDLHPAHRGDER